MKELRRQGTDLKMRILSGIYGFISKVVEASFDVYSTLIWILFSWHKTSINEKHLTSQKILWLDG